jgi:hypothetical protein
MNKIIIISVLIFFTLVNSCTPKYVKRVKGNYKVERKQSGEVRINGILISKINMEPLPNAYISINNTYFRSDDKGLFHFDSLKEGFYDIKFKYVGHDSIEVKKLHIVNGEELFIKVELGYHIMF